MAKKRAAVIGLKPIADKPGHFLHIHKDQLLLDPAYQRDPATADWKVERIAAEWSWVALGVLLVARRGDKHYVVDGSHRTLAARRRPDVQALPCLVFDLASVVAEAAAFLMANTNRRPLSSIDRFRAQVAVGNDAAGFVSALLAGSRYEIAPAPVPGKRQLACIGRLMKFARYDRAALVRAWPLVVDLAGGGTVREQVLAAVTYVEARIPAPGSLTLPPWRATLLGLGMPGVVELATQAALREGKGGDRVWGLALAAALSRRAGRPLNIGPPGRQAPSADGNGPRPGDPSPEEVRRQAEALRVARNGAPPPPDDD